MTNNSEVVKQVKEIMNGYLDFLPIMMKKDSSVNLSTNYIRGWELRIQMQKR